MTSQGNPFGTPCLGCLLALVIVPFMTLLFFGITIFGVLDPFNAPAF